MNPSLLQVLIKKGRMKYLSWNGYSTVFRKMCVYWYYSLFKWQEKPNRDSSRWNSVMWLLKGARQHLFTLIVHTGHLSDVAEEQMTPRFFCNSSSSETPNTPNFLYHSSSLKYFFMIMLYMWSKIVKRYFSQVTWHRWTFPTAIDKRVRTRNSPYTILSIPTAFPLSLYQAWFLFLNSGH